MKIIEFQVNDWVDDEGIKRQIECLDFANACQGYDDEFYPILLTEDMLMENGFVYDDDWNCWLFEDFIISDYEEPFHAAVCGRKVIFQYVHELQHALRLVGLKDFADNFKVD